MSISYGVVYEIRTTGSSANGGGFINSVPGTSVDYSQQNAAELAITDLVSDGAGTGLSSATGGFTAAMVGNLMRIESTGLFVAGWYEIKGYTDTNNITVDRSVGTSKSGGVANVGGAWNFGNNLEDDFFENLNYGGVLWMKAGTYVQSENISTTKAGSTSSGYMQLIGYNTTRGDNPTGTNRPLITGDRQKSVGGYWIIRNLQLTGNYGGDFFLVNTYSYLINCYVLNEYNSAGCSAFRCAGVGTYLVGCEFTKGGSSRLGECVDANNSAVHMIGCYVHDGAIGVYGPNSYSSVYGCVIANCDDYGIEPRGNANVYYGNTIYNCGDGFSITGGSVLFGMFNNIIKGCTVGANVLASPGYGHWIFNNVFDNTTDLNDVYNEFGNLLSDPLLTNPATLDFTLGVGSPAIDVALGLKQIGSLTV